MFILDKYILVVTISLLIQISVTAQYENDSIEVYLIDAYVKPEPPNDFILSFFTSDYCKSKVLIDHRYEYVVSNEMADMHKTKIAMSSLKFNDKIVTFVIITEDSSGHQFTSEAFDFDLPYEPQIVGGANFLQLCLFGGTVFLLPFPNLVLQNGNVFFSLTKEISVVSFRSKSLNYPSGYISLEYSYIFEADAKSYLRGGYKYMYEIPYIEYISPGATLYSNFLGNTGIGLELSLGLFTIVDSFTLYGRYRYNINPGSFKGNFTEITIGLYSGFFSIYLN